MTFDEAGTLWIGDFDGFIGGYEYDDWLNVPLQEQKELYDVCDWVDLLMVLFLYICMYYPLLFYSPFLFFCFMKAAGGRWKLDSVWQ